MTSEIHAENVHVDDVAFKSSVWYSPAVTYGDLHNTHTSIVLTVNLVPGKLYNSGTYLIIWY